MQRKRVPSELDRLLNWYCPTILNVEYSYTLHGYHQSWGKKALAATKELGAGITELILLVMDLHIGNEHTDYLPWNDWAKQGKLKSPVDFWTILYYRAKKNTALSLLQDALEIKPMPTPYDTQGVAEWVRLYGKRALERKLWNGIVEYPPFHDPRTNPLPTEELAQIVGVDLAALAIKRLEELEASLVYRSETKLPAIRKTLDRPALAPTGGDSRCDSLSPSGL